MTHRSDHGSIENGTLIHSSRTVRFALAVVLLAALCCLQVALGSHTSQASADACSNAEFRTGPSANLPECRAYELVSPPRKDGGEVTSITTFKTRSQAAEDGDGLAYPLSVGSGEETGSVSAAGAFQRAIRGEDGWTTKPIQPPVASFSQFTAGFGPIALNSDLSRAIQHTNIDENGVPLVDGSGDPLAGGSLLLENLDTNERDMIFVNPNENTPGSIANTNTALSDDFDPVYFQTAEELTPDALPGTENIYKHENGQNTLVSIRPDGTPTQGILKTGGSEKGLRHTSASGDVLYFWTDQNVGQGNIIRREDEQSVLINASESGGPESNATYLTNSGDGSKALFRTVGDLVDDDTQGNQDLYLYTHSADPDNDDNLRFLSADNEPLDGTAANVQGLLGASDDLTRVYFVTKGQLIPGEPTAPANKLYLWEDGPGNGTLTYIGGAANANSPMWQNHSVPLANARDSSVSADGRFGMARTNDALSAEDNGGLRQIYLFDADADEWHCASCRPDGDPPAAAAQLRETTDFPRINGQPPRNLSSDGHVFFETAEPLVPADINDEIDVYVWKDGEVDLVSTGRSTSPSRFLDADADGSNVFFTTREHLTPWDTDGRLDAYVARIGGGLPAPDPEDPPCVGDECQDDPIGAPTDHSPSSAGVFPGNPDREATDTNCSRFDKKAKKTKQQSRKLKKKANRTNSKKRSKQLKAKAKKQKQKSKRLKQRARNCRGGSQ